MIGSWVLREGVYPRYDVGAGMVAFSIGADGVGHIGMNVNDFVFDTPYGPVAATQSYDISGDVDSASWDANLIVAALLTAENPPGYFVYAHAGLGGLQAKDGGLDEAHTYEFGYVFDNDDRVKRLVLNGATVYNATRVIDYVGMVHLQNRYGLAMTWTHGYWKSEFDIYTYDVYGQTGLIGSWDNYYDPQSAWNCYGPDGTYNYLVTAGHYDEDWNLLRDGIIASSFGELPFGNNDVDYASCITDADGVVHVAGTLLSSGQVVYAKLTESGWTGYEIPGASNYSGNQVYVLLRPEAGTPLVTWLDSSIYVWDPLKSNSPPASSGAITSDRSAMPDIIDDHTIGFGVQTVYGTISYVEFREGSLPVYWSMA